MTRAGDRGDDDDDGSIAFADAYQKALRARLQHCDGPWEEALLRMRDIADNHRPRGADQPNAHQRRKKFVIEMRDGVMREATAYVEIVKSRLRKATKDAPVTLTSSEANALLRALEPRQTLDRGSPPILEEYHTWIAIHFHWLTSQGRKPREAYKLVGTEWCVTRTTIVEAIKSIRDDNAKTHYVREMLANAAEKNPSFIADLYVRMIRFLMAAED